MTNPVQCVACGGIYARLLADGTEYYHACPPQKVIVGAVVDPVSGKVTTPAQFAPIANRRDENVKLGADGKPTSKLGDPNGYTSVTDTATLAAIGAAQGGV